MELFFEEVILYKVEMANNGIILLFCKIKVVFAQFCLLYRFFIYLNNVLFRIKDTRVYVDFNFCEVIKTIERKKKLRGYDILARKSKVLFSHLFVLVKLPYYSTTIVYIANDSITI